MMNEQILIRNMEESKRIVEKGLWYTEEEFASKVLGRRNIVNEGMILGSQEWPMDPVKRIRGMFLRIWPF